MSFDNKLPEWKNTGTEPPQTLQDEGFKSGYKPPAGIFNWFWSKVSRAITELQTKAVEKGNLLNADLNEAVESGIYRFNIPVANGPSMKYGQLLVLHGEGDTIAQIAFGYEGKIEYRAGNPTLVGGTGDWTPWLKVYDEKRTVPIENGGTGATTAAGALSTLGAAAAKHKGQHNRLNGVDPVTLSEVAYFGVNPIDFNDEEADAIQNWVDKGSGYCYYSKEGDYGVQPSRYGQLVNLVTGADVFQLWHTLPKGPNYIRSGSGTAGWVSGWVKLYDEENKPTPDALGVADYVVKQGTEGVWRYRIWKSKKAELWGKIPYDGIEIGNEVSSGYDLGGYVSDHQEVDLPLSMVINGIDTSNYITTNLIAHNIQIDGYPSGNKYTFRVFAPGKKTMGTGYTFNVYLEGNVISYEGM